MKKHLNQKVESEGTPKLGPYWKLQPVCCLQGKYGVEIRIMSMNKDNSHSWVRISHGLNKLVTNLNNNEQETSEVQFEEYALRLNAGDFASRSKAKAKPQRRDSASSSTRTIPIGERTWTDVEPGEYSISDSSSCHGSLPRKNDGAIEFWERQIRNISCIVIIEWKKSMARRERNESILIHLLRHGSLPREML